MPTTEIQKKLIVYSAFTQSFHGYEINELWGLQEKACIETKNSPQGWDNHCYCRIIMIGGA